MPREIQAEHFGRSPLHYEGAHYHLELPGLCEISIRTLILRCRQESHADLTTRLSPAVFGVGVAERFGKESLTVPSFGAGRSGRNRCELGSELEGSNDMVDSRIIHISTGEEKQSKVKEF